MYATGHYSNPKSLVAINALTQRVRRSFLKRWQLANAKHWLLLYFNCRCMFGWSILVKVISSVAMLYNSHAGLCNSGDDSCWNTRNEECVMTTKGCLDCNLVGVHTTRKERVKERWRKEDFGTNSLARVEMGPICHVDTAMVRLYNSFRCVKHDEFRKLLLGWRQLVMRRNEF